MENIRLTKNQAEGIINWLVMVERKQKVRCPFWGYSEGSYVTHSVCKALFPELEDQIKIMKETNNKSGDCPCKWFNDMEFVRARAMQLLEAKGYRP